MIFEKKEERDRMTPGWRIAASVATYVMITISAPLATIGFFFGPSALVGGTIILAVFCFVGVLVLVYNQTKMNGEEKRLVDLIVMTTVVLLFLPIIVFFIVYDGFTLASVSMMFIVTIFIFMYWRDQLSGIKISKKEWYFRGLVSVVMLAILVLFMVNRGFTMYSVVPTFFIVLGILGFSYWRKITKQSV